MNPKQNENEMLWSSLEREVEFVEAVSDRADSKIPVNVWLAYLKGQSG